VKLKKKIDFNIGVCGRESGRESESESGREGESGIFLSLTCCAIGEFKSPTQPINLKPFISSLSQKK